MIKRRTPAYAIAILMFLTIVCVSFSLSFAVHAEGDSTPLGDREYAVEYSLVGVSAEAFEYTKEGNDYTAKFIPMKEHTMPTTIVVSIGGRIINADEYEYDAQKCSLVIPADKISGNVSISVRGDKISPEMKNANLNIFLYSGMALSIITACCSVLLLVTNKDYKGKI